MKEIDKNDVDISRLFRWSKEIPLSDPFTGTAMSVFIRLVGDADMNRAKAYGYRKSADLRKRLKTPDSDERVIFLTELDSFTEEEALRQAVMLLELPEYYQEALKVVDVKEPKEPKAEASLEEQENYQLAVDEYPNKYSKEVERLMIEAREDRREELLKLSKDALYTLYENTVINRLCEEELKEEYYKMCVFLGAFLDEDFKKRAFTDFNEFENIHPQLKVILKQEYQNLELGTDLLKKLQGVTE